MSPSPDKRFRAALVQLRSGRSIAANLEQAEALIRRAAQGGAVYVQTPENTAIMELKPELVLEAAQTEGESVPLTRLRALAAELGIFLHIGSLAIKLDADARGQPLLSHRSRRRDRRALRQAAYVRRRPRRRGKLSRVPALPGPAPRRFSPICPSAGSVFRSATTSASLSSTGRSLRPAPISSPCPPPSPSRRARPIGMC